MRIDQRIALVAQGLRRHFAMVRRRVAGRIQYAPHAIGYDRGRRCRRTRAIGSRRAFAIMRIHDDELARILADDCPFADLTTEGLGVAHVRAQAALTARQT